MAEKDSFAQQKKFNWGIKLGLNAVAVTNYETYNDGQLIANDSYTNKNGYTITSFSKFNVNNRIFMQPEVAWNYTRMGISFILPSENEENIPIFPTHMNIKSQSARGNFLTGYNVVNNGPFTFSAFVGAGFSGIYKTKYITNASEEFSDNTLQIKILGIAGFSIIISRIYFDFRYEINQPNTNLDFSHISGFPEKYKGIDIKKNENILNFSCGFVF
jgi:hypothetical protein